MISGVFTVHTNQVHLLSAEAQWNEDGHCPVSEDWQNLEPEFSFFSQLPVLKINDMILHGHIMNFLCRRSSWSNPS